MPTDAQPGIAFQSPATTGTVLGGPPENRALRFGIDYAAPGDALFADFRAFPSPPATAIIERVGALDAGYQRRDDESLYASRRRFLG